MSLLRIFSFLRLLQEKTRAFHCGGTCSFSSSAFSSARLRKHYRQFQPQTDSFTVQQTTTTTLGLTESRFKSLNIRRANVATATPLFAIESRKLRFYNNGPGSGSSTSSSSNSSSSSSRRNLNNNTTKEDSTSAVPLNLSTLIQNMDGQIRSKIRPAATAKFNIGNSIHQSMSTNGNNSSGKISRKGQVPTIILTQDEQELFHLLTRVIRESKLTSTLRVAGGWVRDKILATQEISRVNGGSVNGGSGGGGGENPVDGGTNGISTAGKNQGEVERLTSKFKGPSSGRQGSKLIGVVGSSSTATTSTSLQSLVDKFDVPVDIDIALDNMLGREFADHLNDWLMQHGRDKISVGVVLKNPEKSKHLETATMKVGKFWIDFVNLRAEEYTEDSRIPDLMRIGTAEEDAYRRDLTINSLFYNINTGEVEDFTGRGFDDLKRGVIATPLPPLTTLLDDPLRVLRSVRFAARLRFTMDDSLREAATTESVRIALAQKVARERVGSEVDLMLRSQDPVGAMRLLINLKLAPTVFPIASLGKGNSEEVVWKIFHDGLQLLSTTHNHLCDCKISTPVWCQKKYVLRSATNGVHELTLIQDEESRRRLWYASFLKPLRDYYKNLGQAETVQAGARQGKKASRSVIMKLMVDELKRPLRDAEAVELVMKAADDFTDLINAGCDLSATACLLGNVRVVYHENDDKHEYFTSCHMGTRDIDSTKETDPVWKHAMEFRLLVSKIMLRVGPLWRASLILSLSEQLATLENEHLSYTIEGDVVSIHNSYSELESVAFLLTITDCDLNSHY
jgi:tRNA nucleotidyltransferase/poly(A) polymerase